MSMRPRSDRLSSNGESSALLLLSLGDFHLDKEAQASQQRDGCQREEETTYDVLLNLKGQMDGHPSCSGLRDGHLEECSVNVGIDGN